MLSHIIDDGLDADWSILDAYSFGCPLVDFTRAETIENDVFSDIGVFQSWIECEWCKFVLEFPNQPHYCVDGLTTTLNMLHVTYYPECARCFCVLVHPCQPHRCPDVARDSCQEYDWIECKLCACVLDYPRQRHSCPEEDGGFVDGNSSEEDDTNFRLLRQRL